MTLIRETICFKCKNLIYYPQCRAFLDEIPLDIRLGEKLHTKKHPDQDNDIVFEPIKE